jgi:hypothetical protein
MSLACWILSGSVSLITNVSVAGGQSKTKYASVGSTCWPLTGTAATRRTRKKVRKRILVVNAARIYRLPVFLQRRNMI